MSVTTSVSYVDISNNEPDSIQARINSKSITIPASVVEITDNSFENSIVESIIFMGDSQLKTIGKAAFKNCKFLKSIQIPPSVVEIADKAFFDSSLEEIVITHDSQLKIIGKGVFRDCKFLKSITIPGSVLMIGDSAFSHSSVQTIVFADNSRLETIGELAFHKCESLQSMKIPSSVVAIDDAAFSESAIKQVLFSDDSKLEILSDFIFQKCVLLKFITIPASILEIGKLAFFKSGIEEVIFSDNSNLKTLGVRAFHQARLSKRIEIPNSVVTIAERAFAKCNKLEEVIFSVNSQLETIGKEAFGECWSLKSFIFPQSLREIGSLAFLHCSRLPKSITLLSTSVEFLGDPFFRSGVNEIIFGNSGKTQTTEKNDHFLQLCKEGDLSKCKEYIEQNHINLSCAKRDASSYIFKVDDAVSIAMDTKNVDLIIFLITNKVLMYSQCEVSAIKKCFSDDDIFERVFFESGTIFWYSICSLVVKKVYNLIRRLLKMLRSKEYVEEWVNIFRSCHQITPLQCVTQGASSDFYHFLIDYDLVKLADLEVKTIKKYFKLAFKAGNVAILKKSLEILPIENVSFKFTDFLMCAPQDSLYSMIEYALPYVMKNEDPLGLIIEGRFENDDNFVAVFPETVLSYLAYAQAFDAFKYIIENVPNTQYTPSHLVACSLFRGYSDAKHKRNVDISNFMKLFDYILQDDIRPYVLGEDKEWVGKSIFTCIKYGSSEMCVKLFSYGFDKNDVYIDVIPHYRHSSLIRYSLLSYACRYQSLEVVQYLIDARVSVDGLLPNHTRNSNGSNKDDQNCINIAYEDEDEDELQCDSNDYFFEVTNLEEFVFADIYLPEVAWFEPYFNPYILNKNQDVDIGHNNIRPFGPSTEDPFVCFSMSGSHLTLLNVTPLGAAIHAEDVDLVRLLLRNGANPNANTFSGFPHLFVLGAGKVINLNTGISVKSPELERPMIDVPSDEHEIIEDESKDDGISVSIVKFAIFKELAEHGADLFHDQTVSYVADIMHSVEFNIYNLCSHLNYSLNLLKYLQKIPQLGDKVIKYYMDSFRPSIVKSGHPLLPVDTVDYMFENGYLHFETYKKDQKFNRAVTLHSCHRGLKPVLEKYGFHFEDLIKK